MAFAINTINGHGSGNKMHCQLQPKKTKVAVLFVDIATKDVLPAVHCLKN